MSSSTAPRLTTLILLTALSITSLNLYLPSMAEMAVDFEVDYALISASVGGFLAITAVLQLIIGPLSDRYGRRPVLLISMAIFTVASIGCTLTSDIYVFLGFRVLQGAVVAASALPRAIIRDTSPVDQAAAKIAHVSMVMALAPLLAPAVGGILGQEFGWRSNFALLAVFGAGLLVLCWADLGETNQHKGGTISAQFRNYPTLLGSAEFWGYSLTITFSTGAFFAFISGAPMVAAVDFDLPPAELGIAIGIITSGFMAGTFISGRAAGRVALPVMMVAGRLVGSIGLSVGIVAFVTGYGNMWLFFGSVITVGIGNGLTNPSGNAGALSVRPDMAGAAAGLSGSMMVAGGAVMSTLAGLVVTETGGAIPLLLLMLFTTIISLISALAIWLRNRK
ncbi:MAG: multidrug effflux MFS transporter [Pikeienuella sp.]